MSTRTRTPLKDKPLRNPGQSVEEEHRKLFEDKLEPFLLTALLFALLAGFEWYRYLAEARLNPILLSMVALLGVLIAARQFFRIRPQLQALRLGAEGEKAVGQFLERLRADGYQVFHDVVGSGFNVDHVLVGPAGVFTVETKTWSKPLGGSPRVTFDGSVLTAGAFRPDRDPVAQARAQASWLAQLLSESTGRTYRVAPVIVFPGWFVEQAEKSRADLWILEPKMLPGFLKNEPLRLAPEAVQLASFHLSRFIRSGERERAHLATT